MIEKKSLVTMSAGNFGRSFSFICSKVISFYFIFKFLSIYFKKLGLDSTVIMPGFFIW